jgi:hypothetical protein
MHPHWETLQQSVGIEFHLTFTAPDGFPFCLLAARSILQVNRKNDD